MDRGQSLIIPPLFDGSNYAYWKVHTRAFLQSLDENVWQTLEIGWTKPTKENFNSRALNALFIVVTNDEFKKISFTQTAKEAQTIVQTTYERTKVVKIGRASCRERV